MLTPFKHDEVLTIQSPQISKRISFPFVERDLGA